MPRRGPRPDRSPKASSRSLSSDSPILRAFGLTPRLVSLPSETSPRSARFGQLMGHHLLGIVSASVRSCGKRRGFEVTAESSARRPSSGLAFQWRGNPRHRRPDGPKGSAKTKNSWPAPNGR
jgi:hypothetical protein